MESSKRLRLVFDTNIIIDALNGIDAGAEEIRAAAERDVSIISWMEVLAGCKSPQTEAVARRLLARFRVVPVTPDIAERAIELRRTASLKLPDAIVLATAHAAGCQLSTRNTRDFRETDPAIRVPYRL